MHGGHFLLCLRCMGINNLDKYYFMLSPVLISCLLTEWKNTAVMHIYSFICPRSFLVGRNKKKQHSPLFTYFCRFSCSKAALWHFFKKKTVSWRKTHRREKYQEFTVYKKIGITWLGMAWRHFLHMCPRCRLITVDKKDDLLHWRNDV
jgi:hypothetical protein